MLALQLEHLETLAAVIEEGTFDAAARRLHITASAVSQRIKALEQTAGQVLVQRSNPVRASEAGVRILRYAQQVQLLGHDLEKGLTGSTSSPSIAIAVNADSLATWFLPALARAHASTGAVFDVHREDQDHTASLRAGTVMAAVTAEKRAVQGCTVTALGIMRYRAVATPAFREQWMPTGTLQELDGAPIVNYDRTDDLQHGFLSRHLGRAAQSPRHYVPTSGEFARALIHGMGWGLLPDQQSAEPLREGSLIELSPGESVDVRLHWQRWNLQSALLDDLTAIVVEVAREQLPSV